jgi:AraC-like DNA-binding protein
METTDILIVIVLSIGAIQGFVFGAILLQSSSFNKTANRFLAALLILFSYRLLVQIMRLFGIGYYDTWYYLMLDLSWIHGALLYGYVYAQTHQSFQLKPTHLVHALPILFQVIFSVFVRIQNLYWDGTKESLSWAGYWGYWVWMNQPTIYIVASVLIVSYAHQAEKYLSAPHKNVVLGEVRLNWLKRIIRSFKIYFSLVFLVLITDMLFIKLTTEDYYFYFTRFYYYPFFIGISLMTYWIGIEGFRRKDSTDITYTKPLDPKRLAQLEQVINDLQGIMRDKQVFKDPNLSLNKTADILHIKPYILTQALNEVLQTKFNDYVNACRIAEVQSLLLKPEKRKHNLLTLAFEAGFNSKSSFNRSVNKQLGISPNELRKSADIKLASNNK